MNPAALQRALQLARKAVELDPLLPEAHAALGAALTWLHQHDASVGAFERAVALNPNNADWRFGWALISAGDSRRAIEVLRGSMRLDPFHGPLLLFYLWVAHFMLEDYPDALAIMRDFVAQAPVRPWGHAMLALIFAQLGQAEDAKTETTETLRLDSTFAVSAKSVAAFRRPEHHEHFCSAWRRAGFS